MSHNLIEQAQDSLEKGDMGFCFQCLKDFLNSFLGSRDGNSYDELLLLKSRFNNLKKDRFDGIIQQSHYEISYNKLIKSTINLINECKGLLNKESTLYQMKQRKVLIIENDKRDFIRISKTFNDAGWSILPERFEDLNEFYDSDKQDDLIEEVEKIIYKEFPNIGIIILDIDLFGEHETDMFGLFGILPAIREINFSKNINSHIDGSFIGWGTQVPIIAFSTFDDLETKRIALSGNHHVHTYLSKDQGLDDETELVLTASALSSIFRMNMENGGYEDNLDKLFESFSNYMTDRNQAIESKLNNITLLIEGNSQKIIFQLDIILKAQLKTFNDQQLKDFLREFKDQIKKILGEEEFKQMVQKLENPSFIDMLKSSVSDGKFTVLVEYIVSLSEELELSNAIPGGKIIGLLLTSICKVLEN